MSKAPRIRGGSKWEPVVTLPTPLQESALQDIDDELTKLQHIFKASSPDLEAEQAAWEKEGAFTPRLGGSHRLRLDRRCQTNGGRTEGTWEFVGKNEAPVFSKRLSRRQIAAPEQTIQHGFRNAHRKFTVAEGDRLFAYVWLDPEAPPETVMLQWNDGTWNHRAFWGADKINLGEIGSDTPAHKPMGPLPTLGEWVALGGRASRRWIGTRERSQRDGFCAIWGHGLLGSCWHYNHARLGGKTYAYRTGHHRNSGWIHLSERQASANRSQRSIAASHPHLTASVIKLRIYRNRKLNSKHRYPIPLQLNPRYLGRPVCCHEATGWMIRVRLSNPWSLLFSVIWVSKTGVQPA